MVSIGIIFDMDDKPKSAIDMCVCMSVDKVKVVRLIHRAGLKATLGMVMALIFFFNCLCNPRIFVFFKKKE